MKLNPIRLKQFGRFSKGNAWMVYGREFNKSYYEYRTRYLSMREINQVMSCKPSTFRRQNRDILKKYRYR